MPPALGIDDRDTGIVLLDALHGRRGLHLDAFGLLRPLGQRAVHVGAMHDRGGVAEVDQRTLTRAIGVDSSTIATVIDRLKARGLMRRNASSDDRRVRLLSLTDAGRSELAAVLPAMQRAQERILEPLPKAECAEFMRMLRTLVAANNGLSRAPGSP